MRCWGLCDLGPKYAAQLSELSKLKLGITEAIYQLRHHCVSFLMLNVICRYNQNVLIYLTL
jgi:hypothetical protein